MSRSGTRRLASDQPAVDADDLPRDVPGVAGVAALVSGWLAWTLGGAVAALTFLTAEAAETVLAEVVQRRRGDPDAENEQA
jgi:hypothetical protein